MNRHSLRGSAAIVGVGHAGLGDASGRSEIEILAEASQNAVRDAGISMRDIDGICTASVNSAMWGLPVAEYLGIQPKFIDSTMLGGSSFVSHLLPAAMALQAGICNAVLVCYGSTQRSGALGRGSTAQFRRQFDPQPYEHPYEPAFPVAAYALAAARHMHEFGTTREQLAEVAVAARKWARLNPEALMRDPLSIEDVLASRMVADPLSVRDCCLVTDGAGAYVMVRADRARDYAKKPVYMLGNASATWHRQVSCMPDVTVTAARESGARAFEMAGLKPSDMDVAELYDAFTINTILFLEDLGFCAKGEGGAFVSGGAIAPGGRLAVNTNGGGLSCTHPGMYGIFITIEAVRQLRGECGERQVRGAQTALVHGNGGMLSAQATAILGTEETL
jgi:acetyl-CoA acetyltransferase